jgi:hypothetical protein
MALYRATGQSHKPTPPVTQNSTLTKIQGGKLNKLNCGLRLHIRINYLATIKKILYPSL